VQQVEDQLKPKPQTPNPKPTGGGGSDIRHDYPHSCAASGCAHGHARTHRSLPHPPFYLCTVHAQPPPPPPPLSSLPLSLFPSSFPFFLPLSLAQHSHTHTHTHTHTQFAELRRVTTTRAVLVPEAKQVPNPESPTPNSEVRSSSLALAILSVSALLRARSSRFRVSGSGLRVEEGFQGKTLRRHERFRGLRVSQRSACLACFSEAMRSDASVRLLIASTCVHAGDGAVGERTREGLGGGRGERGVWADCRVVPGASYKVKKGRETGEERSVKGGKKNV
jgi:hypothetical protein